MPKQIGQVKTLGTIDDRTYYKTKYGYISRSKGTLSKDRINKDPNFARTRENMREFAQAASAGRLFRKAFNTSSKKIRDGRMFLRLNQLMRKVVNTDPLNDRGYRLVANGDISMLKGFNFNDVSRLDEILNAELVITTTENQVIVTMDTIVPVNQIQSPMGATHCRFFGVCAAIDFENGETKEVLVYSEYFPLENNIEEASLTLDTTGYEVFHKFIAVGIEFAEEVNGRQYALNDISYNAMSIEQYVPAT